MPLSPTLNIADFELVKDVARALSIASIALALVPLATFVCVINAPNFLSRVGLIASLLLAWVDTLFLNPVSLFSCVNRMTSVFSSVRIHISFGSHPSLSLQRSKFKNEYPARLPANFCVAAIGLCLAILSGIVDADACYGQGAPEIQEICTYFYV